MFGASSVFLTGKAYKQDITILEYNDVMGQGDLL
jgi:hypothetical protein